MQTIFGYLGNKVKVQGFKVVQFAEGIFGQSFIVDFSKPYRFHVPVMIKGNEEFPRVFLSNNVQAHQSSHIEQRAIKQGVNKERRKKEYSIVNDTVNNKYSCKWCGGTKPKDDCAS